MNQILLKTTHFITVLLLITITSSACGDDDQDPKSLLNSYRIIALRAEPAELKVNSITTLSLYDFHPNELNGDRPTIEYTWTLCPFSLGSVTRYECFLDELPLTADMINFNDSSTDDSSSLRPKANTQLVLNPLEIFASFGEDLAAQMEQIEMGTSMLGTEMNFFSSGVLEVYVKLKVTIEGEPDFSAVKPLTILLDEERQINEHPQFSEISFSTSLDGLSALAIKEELDLEVTVTADSSETYQAPQSVSDQSEEISLNPETESILVYYYSTNGKFDQGVKLADDSQTTLTIDDELGPHKLFVVIRDGRGGVDLRTFNYEVIE